jgi:hypothetical protein
MFPELCGWLCSRRAAQLTTCHVHALLPALLSAALTRSHASGTPLSVLDPPGSTTVEQAYKKIDANLKVRAGMNNVANVVQLTMRCGTRIRTLHWRP